MRRLVVPLASATLALAVLAVVVADVESALRSFLVLMFVLFAPGTAATRWMRVGDALTTVTLALAMSLAIGGVVAGTMIYAGAWSPVGGLTVLVLLTLLGNAADVVASLQVTRR